MADDREVLQDAGKITAEIAKAKAESSRIRRQICIRETERINSRGMVGYE